jgi:hypothetical protein
VSTTPPVSPPWHRVRGGGSITSLAPATAVLAAAVPVLFLHARYQPAVDVRLGSSDARVVLADVAVALVLVAAAARGARTGFAPLRRARGALVAVAALLVWIGASLALPHLRDEPYATADALVSAVKFGEYALLAPAAMLIVRGRRDLELLAGAVVAVSVCATVWAILQFTGAVAAFDAGGQWRRAPSFVGIHDFAALSGAALAIALLALVGGGRLLHPRLPLVAGVFGGLGVVLSGAMTAVIGLILAGGALLLVAARRRRLSRTGAIAAIVLVGAVALGTAAMRTSTIVDFAGFLGLRDDEPSGAVESYAQRSVLAYLGYRIFLDEPVTGVGWQGSGAEWAYGPHLAEARARFPSEPAEAFPSPEHPWGVQNAYVQALADLGVIGLALLVAVLAATAWTAVGRAVRLPAVPLGPAATLGLAWLLVAVGIWNGLGLVSGIPLAALTWIAVGLAGVDG